ncbi:MAG TPA: NADH:flavin oxidoreductase/NADH oxidase [Polyangiaceae bacterium]|nr:NADH:flavin oxidoreductase/NADH oxidase [Polyangiaceae bacterium]
MTAALFQPLDLGPFTLQNRTVVSPMCQYSADDGAATDWHLQHLMQLAFSGASLVMVEATAVERLGRITHGCLGLYHDGNEAALARVMSAARRVALPETRFGIQLAHAGRKASVHVPWEGAKSLAPGEDPWTTLAPSALPFSDGWHVPIAATEADCDRVVAAFVAAAKRAVRLGFDVVELHVAHGYLAAEFMSPLANRRTDEYGGPVENRARLPLRIANAVKSVLPASVALGARIGTSDWTDGGLTVDDAIHLATGLRDAGAHYACCSTNGAVPARTPSTPGFNVPNAARVRAATSMVVRVPGLITTPEQADEIVASGKADLVALARAFLDDPRWAWHAAEKLGAKMSYPPQYERVAPEVWKRQ